MISTFAKIKSLFRSIARVLLNPRLLLCFAIAWLITNGWCYIAIILGSSLNITWLTIVGTAYAGFLWLPFTPEKIVTLALSILLLRVLFPKDEKTLKFLKDKLAGVKAKFQAKRTKKAQKHDPPSQNADNE